MFLSYFLVDWLRTLGREGCFAAVELGVFSRFFLINRTSLKAVMDITFATSEYIGKRHAVAQKFKGK